jgi:protein-ribulosamine 3-kinase
MWGEFYSSEHINAVTSNFVPKPIGKGKYYDDSNVQVCFYLQKYHDLDLQSPPDPADLARKLADLHRNGVSPNGMFGFPVPTSAGGRRHENKWEKTWTAAFITQFKEVLEIDNEANGIWPEYEATCKHMIDKVIPRLLGDGREIKPVLVHFDLWEGNVATDLDTGEIVAFDPVSGYAHNEVEFGTWRCSWSTHFRSPIYMTLYQREIEPSEPVEEWDDRNRLYGLKAFMCDSSGHVGSISRQ